jgi:hydrocephalus-inducing protein
VLDFGCILNNTESVKYVNMTNIGPLIVNYKWSFIIDHNTLIEKSGKNGKMTVKEHDLKSMTNVKKEDTDPLLRQPSVDAPSLDMAVVDLIESNNQMSVDKAYKSEDDEAAAAKVLENIPIHTDLSNLEIKQPINEKLESLLQQESELSLPSYEEASHLNLNLPDFNCRFNSIPIFKIFDITPIYGKLNPGETQKVTVTFFGHKEISANVRAICQVDNGPEYELTLKGEASTLSYEVSDRVIEVGCIVSFYFAQEEKEDVDNLKLFLKPYDTVTESTISVRNKGKVPLDFCIIDFGSQNNVIEPEKPFITPLQVSHERQLLGVFF